MRDIGIQKHLPLLICELKVAAILAWCSLLQQYARQNGISPETHGSFQLADVVLVLEHRLRFDALSSVHLAQQVMMCWQALVETAVDLRL